MGRSAKFYTITISLKPRLSFVGQGGEGEPGAHCMHMHAPKIADILP